MVDMDKITLVRICKVESIHDEYDGMRIKARVLPEDRTKSLDEIPYAFPIMPKMFHVKPKVGEAVIILCSDLNNSESQRFYLGPIISQPHFLNYDPYSLGATTLLNGGVGIPAQSTSVVPESFGALPTDEEIAILGRGKGDIIIGDNDVEIRCGVREKDKYENNKIIFNKTNPAYIKLKQHDKQLSDETSSTVSVVGENINLLSTASKEYFELSDRNDLITDDEMNRILAEAHVLPFGDILVEFLKKFIKAFNAHTHAYNGLPPVQETTYLDLNSFDMDSMLSDNIRIN